MLSFSVLPTEYLKFRINLNHYALTGFALREKYQFMQFKLHCQKFRDIDFINGKMVLCALFCAILITTPIYRCGQIQKF